MCFLKRLVPSSSPVKAVFGLKITISSVYLQAILKKYPIKFYFPQLFVFYIHF